MWKLGGAAIPMKDSREGTVLGKVEGIRVWFGTENPEVRPHMAFSAEAVSFLDACSAAIRQDAEARSYPDILAFAFWIRKANVLRLKGRFEGGEGYYGCKEFVGKTEEVRGLAEKKEGSKGLAKAEEGSRKSSMCIWVGKGLIFHISPSNVAINFAYTFAFGLLSGNANIVRLSSKQFPQSGILCRILQEVTGRKEFQWVESQNGIVSYAHESGEWNRIFSEGCDARVIWGGDGTIREIRKFPINPRSNEITFADRYSFAMISAEAVVELSDRERGRLAEGFYNDTYRMDQNACSTPHLVCWLGSGEAKKEAKKLFWQAVYQASLKYSLEEEKVSGKFALLCQYASNGIVSKAQRYGNYLYVAELEELPENLVALRGKYGMFFEYDMDGIEEILGRVTPKVQTCAVFGIDAGAVARLLAQSGARGIDRIVPMGHTLDMDIVWDGHDVIRELSRCIAAESYLRL